MAIGTEIETILRAAPDAAPAEARIVIGHSRAGRPLHAWRFGNGSRTVSLIAGCHADEPVGPAMLDRLATWLGTRAADHPLLRTFTWHLVPHANPDGDVANALWSEPTAPRRTGFDLASYLMQAVREAPGDDVEFGFPRPDERDGDVREVAKSNPPLRPENQAIATFLRAAAPIDLHASFHGMAFAAGPWFLLEPAWIDRSLPMRDAVRRAVHDLGYRLHDIDRGGDKGFTRIDEGFTTRPNADAMIRHFRDRDDWAMAARFRPSSMDFVRSLGGDPLTLVSEMPLFTTPETLYEADPVRPPALLHLHNAVSAGRAAIEHTASTIGVKAMPIDDQMRLQLAYLDAALIAILNPAAGTDRGSSPRVDA